MLYLHVYKAKLLSHVRLFVTPWTILYQAPQSMEFSRQEYWSGLPFPSPGDFPTQGSNPGLLLCRQMLYPLSHQGRILSQKLHSILFPKGVVSILTFVKNLPELFLPVKWELGFLPSNSHPSLLRAASQLNSSALLISGREQLCAESCASLGREEALSLY